MTNKTNPKILLTVLVLMAAMVCPTATAKTIYVDEDATGANNGSSWDDAYNYLQDALDDADSSTKPVEIWVAQGTYKPDQGGSQTPDDRNARFQIINDVAIYGGFPSGGGTWNDRDPNDPNHKTILSGDIGMPGDNSDNSYHVVTGIETNATALLEGLTITGAQGGQAGGGMFNRDSSPTVTHCVFTGNTVNDYGSGMYNEGSSPTLNNCTFSDNGASYGGAVFNVDSNSTFYYCDFTNNSASESAGAIYNVRSSPFLKTCWFEYNNATDAGGAIYNWDNSSPNLTDCIFIENRSYKWWSSESDAGAIKNSQNSDPTITNCTFYQNSCGSYGGSIFNYNNSNPILQNCTFEDNSAYDGGGIANWDSSPTISNCCFIDNEASSMGGGLFNAEYSNPVVKNCIFERNYAEINGGGLENWYDCSPTVTNCIFYRNAAGLGGGMFNLRSNAIVTNCLFIRNCCSIFAGQGAGMYNYMSSDTTVINCTFFANLTEYGNVAGIFNEGGCTLELTNCILWANTDQGGSDQSAQLSGGIVEVNYSCVQGWDGTLGGNGNIDADPCFVDANGLDDIIGTEDDNLRLMPDSPCIDAGDNSEPNIGATDLDGHPRIIDGDCNDTEVVDMGAYEFNYAYIGDFDYNCSVDFFDFSIFALTWFTEPADEQWNPFCNIGIPADSYIDWRDVEILCCNWLADFEP